MKLKDNYEMDDGLVKLLMYLNNCTSSNWLINVLPPQPHLSKGRRSKYFILQRLDTDWAHIEYLPLADDKNLSNSNDPCACSRDSLVNFISGILYANNINPMDGSELKNKI